MYYVCIYFKRSFVFEQKENNLWKNLQQSNVLNLVNRIKKKTGMTKHNMVMYSWKEKVKSGMVIIECSKKSRSQQNRMSLVTMSKALCAT